MSTENEVEKRGPGRPLNKPAEESEMMQLIKAMGEQNKEQLIALAAELRKPTELEQKKLDEEKVSQLKRAEMAIAVARAQAEQDAITQSNCTHTRHDGVSCFIGQVNSDGYCIPFCTRCRLTTSPIKANDQERVNGIQLQQRGGVTRESLENWARQRAS